MMHHNIEIIKNLLLISVLFWLTSAYGNKKNEKYSEECNSQTVYVYVNDKELQSHTNRDNNKNSNIRNNDISYTYNDSVIDCLACAGTGLSYAKRQTDFLDRDMIGALAGTDKCEVCFGKKKLKKTEMVTRWKTIIELYGDVALVNERLRNTKCTICGGDGKCWLCKGIPPYRNSECYCRGSGTCEICHGTGHL